MLFCLSFDWLTNTGLNCSFFVVDLPSYVTCCISCGFTVTVILGGQPVHQCFRFSSFVKKLTRLCNLFPFGRLDCLMCLVKFKSAFQKLWIIFMSCYDKVGQFLFFFPTEDEILLELFFSSLNKCPHYKTALCIYLSCLVDLLKWAWWCGKTPVNQKTASSQIIFPSIFQPFAWPPIHTSS